MEGADVFDVGFGDERDAGSGGGLAAIVVSNLRSDVPNELRHVVGGLGRVVWKEEERCLVLLLSVRSIEAGGRLRGTCGLRAVAWAELPRANHMQHQIDFDVRQLIAIHSTTSDFASPEPWIGEWLQAVEDPSQDHRHDSRDASYNG